MRAYKTRDQSIYYEKKNSRLHNGRDESVCFDVWGGKNKENQHNTYWPCHGGANQKWSIKYFPGVPKNTGFKNG